MITHNSGVALLVASLLLTGCGADATPTPDEEPAVTRTPGPEAAAGAPAEAAAAEAAARRLPGLGPVTRAGVPPETRQALVVTGRGRNSSHSTVVLYERTDTGWKAGSSWPARNALRGWTDHHLAGDMRSPIGVFTLTDAGGLLNDPGTRLSYDYGDGFIASGTGFEGEPLAGSFDYVIAIDYNRTTGTSPLDRTRPLGDGRGGGIWLHVDHGAPTQACVSLAREHMRLLLLALDPERHPVVVMGDAESLAR
ncbi:L,D-peptidoglycan transpeptidase YkuD, ErfK/YbiS/YcfS/YnhG family [Streptomyces sp. cf386]|uniref:hypothetical protein n=1 Tax=Streptomyces sp. cf386 TaxID=1761904 RepID=UPI000880CD59|nr:hypothetical protein [Streptomyces sp. cf386]SDN42051.1 L,D-peptidoglycan transpeptidase YkuD, ErfK/YbiS/YcfS/YnhG family [Streptomyces sp. cf386]